jgi:hypothetical protein
VKKVTPRRPSAALVVSLVALFVALGGTTYAATSLPINSVGTAQIRNGAIVASKLRKGLTVPNAHKLDGKDLFYLTGQQHQLLPPGQAHTLPASTCAFVRSYVGGTASDAGKIVGMWITDSHGYSLGDPDYPLAYVPGTLSPNGDGKAYAITQVCNLENGPFPLPAGWQVHTVVH